MKTCVLQLCRLGKPGREPGYFWILSMLLLFSHSVVSDSLRPHGLCSQPTRLLCPWDSRGKKYWSGLPFPSPGDLPGPRIKPGSPALQADALPWGPLGRFARPLGIGASRGMGEGEERRQAPPRWGPSVPGGTSGALSQDGCVHFQLADTLSLRTRPRSAAGPWECGGRSSGQGQAELPPWKRAMLAAGAPSEPGTAPSPPGCLVIPTAPPGRGRPFPPLQVRKQQTRAVAFRPGSCGRSVAKLGSYFGALTCSAPSASSPGGAFVMLVALVAKPALDVVLNPVNSSTLLSPSLKSSLVAQLVKNPPAR